MEQANIDRINARLRAAGAAAAGRLHWFAQLDSTNAWLMRHADIHARVCIADWQSAGRGRRGRVWQAPRGSSVLLSIGWEFGAAATAGLALVAGLAVVDALRSRGVATVGLKWPNDLLAPVNFTANNAATGQTETTAQKSAAQKLGGILVEIRGTRGVIGLGLNVDAPDISALPAGGVDLARLGFDGDREALVAALILAFCEYLPRLCAVGFAPFVEPWNRLHCYHRRRVRLQLPDTTLRGMVVGIADDGALLVQDHSELRKVVAATLRADDGRR